MKIKIIFLPAFFLILLYGCSKVCDAPNGNNGIIVKEYSDLDYPCWNFSQDSFLIRNDSQYNAIIKFYNRDVCKDMALVDVDFTQYSLIGLHAKSRNMNNFLRTVTRDDNAKKIIYEIQTNNCSSKLTKEGPRSSANIVYIPAVPEDYTAEFKFREIYN